MWLANFEDGTSVTQKSAYWTDLKNLKPNIRMTGVQLQHPLYKLLQINLAGQECYFYVTNAIAMVQQGKADSNIVSEVIGGIRAGLVTEIILDYPKQSPNGNVSPGSISVDTYLEKDFKWSKDILVKG